VSEVEETPSRKKRRRRRRRRGGARKPPEGLTRIEQAAWVAKDRFGIEQLKPQQEQALAAVLDGKDTLAVLPTGFGKSLIYQVPAMLLDGPTIVVSPLIALMADQQAFLKQRGAPVIRIDSSLRAAEKKEAIEKLEKGGPLVVLTTPESLESKFWGPIFDKVQPALLCIDEAHSISEWGHDFRPAYLRLGQRQAALGNPPVLALTATATPRVRNDIAERLELEDASIVTAPPYRDNLHFEAKIVPGAQKYAAAGNLLVRLPRPGIFYCSTTVEVDRLYFTLEKAQIPVDRYHGKLPQLERDRAQKRYMRPSKRIVMCATSAFGMGIDKPNIRYVVHFQAPASIEQYVQEAGRGGRDGETCHCILLFDPADLEVNKRLLMRSRARPDQLRRVSKALHAWHREGRGVDSKILALSAEVPMTTAASLCARLEEVGLLELDADKQWQRTVSEDEFAAGAADLARRLEVQKLADERRIDELKAYAEAEECRSVYIRRYFGEDDPPRCGVCDWCAPRARQEMKTLTMPGRRGRTGRGGRDGKDKKGRRGDRDKRKRQGKAAADQRPAAANGAANGEGAGKKRRRRRRGGRGRRKGERSEGENAGGAPEGAAAAPRSGRSDGGLDAATKAAIEKAIEAATPETTGPGTLRYATDDNRPGARKTMRRSKRRDAGEGAATSAATPSPAPAAERAAPPSTTPAVAEPAKKVQAKKRAASSATKKAPAKAAAAAEKVPTDTPTAKKATAKKAQAKKPPASSGTAKKVQAKKPSASSGTAKKAQAKKPSASSGTAKKVQAKKPSASSGTAKKATAKKATAKKATAKKATAKKATAKKATAKKATAKKAQAKKPPARRRLPRRRLPRRRLPRRRLPRRRLPRRRLPRRRLPRRRLPRRRRRPEPPRRPPSAEKQLHRDHGADDASDVSGDARRHRVAQLGDTDAAEVDGQHVEGGLRGAVHRAREIADVRVGPVGLEDLGGDAEGPGAGERPQEGERQDLGGQAEDRRQRADPAHDGVEAAGLPEHAHRREDGHEVGDDHRREAEAFLRAGDEDLVDLHFAHDADGQHGEDERWDDPRARLLAVGVDHRYQRHQGAEEGREGQQLRQARRLAAVEDLLVRFHLALGR
jgi:ATP-dependent DNA helicase RecQ